MAKENKKMYSWWWDSHISPKNSKWLKENLTDMDSKVRIMIKLIEVDEDSFARRAEMYYKKRPELMKLVEEFYRAYRALAERYDHATGVIRQAHKTMAEAFPNQVPFLMTDDGDTDPRTPEMQAPGRADFDPDELLKGAIGLSSSDLHSSKENGDFTGGSSALPLRKGSKQLNGFGKARKGLNFQEAEGREEGLKTTQPLSDSERLGRSETDIQALKDALAKLEAEKEAGLLEYQQTLARLSNLESEVSQAKENSQGLNERATTAEAEVQSLKETLVKVEAERESSLLQYQQCLDRISNLESHISRAEQDAGELTDRACQSEREAEVLKEELSRLKAEKEALLAKYMEALEKIANLENKLLLAEDYASRTCERADRAEKEIETLKETVTRLTEEKEAAVLKYEQCLEKISALEREIAVVQEEAERLKAEVEDGAVKLKGSEEQCLLLDQSNKSLQSEVDSLVQKVGVQNQEMSEKQKELGRLWTCVQEERLRFSEAETSFKSLQNVHAKVQEELRSVAAELRNRVELLKDMEVQNHHLEDEVLKVKEENKSLQDLNMSSVISIKSMQEENFELKDGNKKLEQELELRLDQRDALQQEIYCLKEELNNLGRRHQDMLDQVKSLGFEPGSLGLSVKELQDENSELKQSCRTSEVEIAVLLEKLSEMEKLIEKNELLENTLADLQAELDAAREKVKTLEESFQSLAGEKSTLAAEKATLISQLQVTTDNLEKLSQRNTILENSLLDTNAELETLRAQSKILENSCRMLDDQNSVLVSERLSLSSQLETTQQKLEDLGKRHSDSEQRCLNLEAERETTIRRVEELQLCLDVEKQEHSTSSQLSEKRIFELQNKICSLQLAGDHMRVEFEEELDKAVNSQFDIFILQHSIKELKYKNSSLLLYCEKLLDASKLSDKVISELQHANLEQGHEVRVLSSEIRELRMRMSQLLEAVEGDLGSLDDDCDTDDQKILLCILRKLLDIKNSLSQACDENQELLVEKSVLLAVLHQLQQDVADLNTIIIVLRQEIGTRDEQLLLLQKEMQKLLESNEELILKVREGSQKEVVLNGEMEILREKLFNLQGSYDNLQKENCKVVEEKHSLMKAFQDLEEEKHKLELDCSCMVWEAVALDNLSFVFKNVISEKAMQVKELTENLNNFCFDSGLLGEKMTVLEKKLEEVQATNMSLEVSLKKSENELEEVRAANDLLKHEIEDGKDDLCMKEMELSEAMATKIHQENQIRDLSENFAQQLKECKGLRDLIQDLEAQLSKMSKEYEEAEARVGVLNSELQKGKDEVELWEAVSGTFFTELQSSSVREALIKEKFSELMKAYEMLEGESYSKGIDVAKLRGRVEVLEGENSDIKARLAADFSAISSLRDSIASLERHTTWNSKLDKTDDGENQDELRQDSSKDEAANPQLGGFIDLQGVQSRIQAVEKAIIELKQHAQEEYTTVRTDLDSAVKQIEVLKSQSSSRRGSGRFNKSGISEGRKLLKANNDVPESAGDELRMKDIVLDQVSDRYGKSGRKMGSDDPILELWETMDQGGSIDFTVAKSYKLAPAVPNKYSHLEAVKDDKSGRPSSESMVEKELGIDEPDTSKRFLNPDQDEYKRKTLERLASDVQKLTNLQITVQDLKEKLVMTENFSSKGKTVECEGVKDQLAESENTIQKLFEYTGKLMRNVERSSASSSFDATSMVDSSDGGSARRRRCSEQARRISEKIGRLQLEVQKVQFLLMKLDNSNRVSKTGTRITERNTRVLLRDYLYAGGSRTPRRRKKSHFCGCVQPPKGDSSS